MGKIYLNQNSLRLTLNTKVDLNSITSAKIKYEKPSGTTGEWVATVDDPGEGVGSIYYDFAGTELDETKTWTVWAYITFTDGRVAPGEPIKLIVNSEGE